MCSGRVDLEFLLRAFSNGQDGVFIGGCRLGECNYITQGNFDAYGNVFIGKKILSHIGINPDRLAIRFMSAADGNVLAEGINDISNTARELGPLGQSEGLEPKDIKFRLEAARRLVPYIRLVERERLRMPLKTKDAYNEFYSSEEFDRLFDELIADKLAMSEITMLLNEKQLSTGEIAESLGLSPSDVSKHIINSSRQGFVRYDENLKSYALA